jgi:hypothetical protein
MQNMQQEIQFDDINNIDMSYDTNANNPNNIAKMDENIAKDRYSRYIGAMGMESRTNQMQTFLFPEPGR